MALQHVIGLDHVVVAVRDLDAAAAAWQAVGFTLSPRGTHSAHMGSGNYTIMLGEDYIELLGVLAPTEHNAPMRTFLQEREGLDRAAFTTDDAKAGVAELRAKGIEAIGPVSFGRPVSMPGGGQAEARFEVFRWPAEMRPGGLGIFACQHLTRQNVWIPALQGHANAATRLIRIEVLTPEPEAAARELAGLLDREPTQQTDGAWRVPSGAGRADFDFLHRDTLARRHGDLAASAPLSEGAVALVLGTSDLSAARQVLGGRDAAWVTGVLLRFEAV
jgi:catechol 2,3-dioxygenase-like lactoylglutathione lyase family enzyme